MKYKASLNLLPCLTDAIQQGIWDGAFVPIVHTDYRVKDELGLPEMLRPRAVSEMLAALISFSRTIPDKQAISMVFWSWRLLAFNKKESSDDPEVFLSCEKRIWDRRKMLFDFYEGWHKDVPVIQSVNEALRREVLISIPFLNCAPLVRTLMLSLWDMRDLSCQHLTGHEHAGDLLLHNLVSIKTLGPSLSGAFLSEYEHYEIGVHIESTNLRHQVSVDQAHRL